MLVHHAVLQARLADAYLYNLDEKTVAYLADQSSSYLTTARLAQFTSYDPFSQRDLVIQLSETATTLDRLISQIQQVPLSFDLRVLHPTLRDLISRLYSYQLSFKEFLPLPHIPPTNRSAFESIDSLPGKAAEFYRVYREARATADAWEAFAQDDETQLFALDFSADPLTLRQWIAWLTFWDGLMDLARIAAGEKPGEPQARIERLESGSIVQDFKNVPPAVWEQIRQFFAHGINPQATKTDNLSKLLDVIAKLQDMESRGIVTSAQAEAIREKLMAINEVPLPNQELAVTIDRTTYHVRVEDLAPRQLT